MVKHKTVLFHWLQEAAYVVHGRLFRKCVSEHVFWEMRDDGTGNKSRACVVLHLFLFNSNASKCVFTFFSIYMFYILIWSSTVVSRTFVGIGIF